MRTILLILLMILPARVIAPCDKSLPVIKPKAVDPLEILWKATCIVESNNNPNAIGDKHLKQHSYGIVQIRQSRISDYNKLTEKDYKLEDAFDPAVSREIFFYYAVGDDLERIAREWNGGPKGMSKSSTITYWNKIKTYL